MDDSVGMNCASPVANPSSKLPGIISDSVSGVHERIKSAAYNAHGAAKSRSDETIRYALSSSPRAARAHVAIAPSVYTLVAIHARSSTPHPNAHARATTTPWRRYFRDDGIARRVARPPRAARDDENDEEEEEEDDIAREVVGIVGIARVNISVARALE